MLKAHVIKIIELFDEKTGKKTEDSENVFFKALAKNVLL